jgi:hypothetical protein
MEQQPISSFPETTSQETSDGELSHQILSSCSQKLNNLLIVANNSKIKYVEDYCRLAIEQIHETFEQLPSPPPPAPPSPLPSLTHTSNEMVAAGLLPMDINFNLRFNRRWDPNEKLKKSSSLFSLGTTALAPNDYENVTSEKILFAPIRDLCFVQRNDSIPEGFFRLTRTPNNKKADFNTGSGGNHLYLCIKKETNNINNTATSTSGGKADSLLPITSLVVLYPDRKESVPPGFSVVKRSGKPCNVNAGTNAERIYLCYKRDNVHNPLIDILIYFPSKSEAPPISFTKVTRSTRNCLVDLNAGTGAAAISLCLRYQCSNLNFLLPETSSLDLIGPGAQERSECSPQDLLSIKEENEALAKISRRSLDRRLSAQSSLGEDVDERDLKKIDHLVSPGSGGGGEKEFDILSDDGRTETRTPKFLSEDSPELQSSSSDPTERRLSNSALQELEHQARRDSDVLTSISEGPGTSGGVGGDQIEDDNVSVGGQSVTDFETTSPRLSRQCVVTVYDQPIPPTYGYILRALLSGLFTTGEVIDTTVDLLTTLINEDTLMKSDFLIGHPPSDGLTMIDVIVSAICERLDWCGEIISNRLLELIHLIILKSQGKLSKLSTQLIFRATLFVCSTYSSRLDWLVAGSTHPVLEDGKEIYAFFVLKQLCKSIIALAEQSPVEHFLPTTPLTGEAEGQGDYYNLGYLVSYGESFLLVSDIVTQFIDEVMEAVEISKVTEVALQCTSKRNSNILSPSFWIQINEISQSLFNSYEIQNAFILLSALCKWSWMEVKYTPNGQDISPRYLGNKLLSIEALREFCHLTGPQLRASKIMGYQVRRTIVSVIFANMQYSMSQPRIFLKLLQLVSCIWENWREHIRLEFPVLCEQLIIKILQAPTLKMPPLIHLIALIEIMKWFEQPQMLIEMFVNFDMDLVVAADWNIFSHLIRAVCSFAEKASRPITITGSGALTGPFPSEASAVGSLSTMFGMGCLPVQARDVKIKALEVVATITRAMMDATGHANLIYMDIIASHEDGQTDTVTTHNNTATDDEDDDVSDLPSSTPTPGHLKRRVSYSITHRRAVSLHSAELLQQAIKIYQEKESVGKAIKFLLSKNFMSDNPHEIAGFVRIYKDSFDPVSIGEFLGEGGRNTKEEEYWNAIRYRFTRAVSFVDLHLYDALRLYLTNCGFRMPGEAQKIDRFISAFVKVYWEDNRGTEFCPFHHEDTIHLLAYAIIMLNTDLHRANLDKKKGGKKMSKMEYIRNLRGADAGNDINPDYLGLIYDDIFNSAIEMEITTTSSSNALSAFTSTRDDNGAGTVTDMDSHRRYVADLLKNLRSSGDLMRSLSPYTHMFHIVGVNINISMELVSFMFESVWHHFHAIVDGILTKMSNEENIIFSALDVLCNSLTSCIFLNLKVEKLAFATQLARFRQICEAANVEDLTVTGKSSSTQTPSSSSTPVVPTSTGGSVVSTAGASFASGVFRQEKWFISVENSTAETAIAAIAEVHSLVSHLKDLVRQCARREATKLVFARIEKRANLNDGLRFFIMEGDLRKKNRAGKYTLYRFFLFSDCLVYAHFGFSEYKVHGQLSLDATSIESTVPDDVNNCCFIIDNPTKSFVVMTESHYDKQLWVRSINDAIASCERRRRGRRLSILDRMESQEKEVIERQLLHETLAKPARQSNLQIFVAGAQQQQGQVTQQQQQLRQHSQVRTSDDVITCLFSFSCLYE